MFDCNAWSSIVFFWPSVSVAFGKRYQHVETFHFVTFSSFRFQLEPIQTKPKSGAPSNTPDCALYSPIITIIITSPSPCGATPRESNVGTSEPSNIILLYYPRKKGQVSAWPTMDGAIPPERRQHHQVLFRIEEFPRASTHRSPLPPLPAKLLPHCRRPPRVTALCSSTSPSSARRASIFPIRLITPSAARRQQQQQHRDAHASHAAGRRPPPAQTRT